MLLGACPTPGGTLAVPPVPRPHCRTSEEPVLRDFLGPYPPSSRRKR